MPVLRAANRGRRGRDASCARARAPCPPRSPPTTPPPSSLPPSFLTQQDQRLEKLLNATTFWRPKFLASAGVKILGVSLGQVCVEGGGEGSGVGSKRTGGCAARPPSGAFLHSPPSHPRPPHPPPRPLRPLRCPPPSRGPRLTAPSRGACVMRWSWTTIFRGPPRWRVSLGAAARNECVAVRGCCEVGGRGGRSGGLAPCQPTHPPTHPLTYIPLPPHTHPQTHTQSRCRSRYSPSSSLALWRQWSTCCPAPPPCGCAPAVITSFFLCF